MQVLLFKTEGAAAFPPIFLSRPGTQTLERCSGGISDQYDSVKGHVLEGRTERKGRGSGVCAQNGIDPTGCAFPQYGHSLGL